MPITFIRDTAAPEPSSFTRTLTIMGERGYLSVALCLTRKDERVSLGHELRRADIVRLAEGLKAWLDSADSYPPCQEPACSNPALYDSDFCGGHQD